MSHRPFDARLQLLTDRSAAPTTWSTVSLVLALREYVSRDPSSVFPACDENARLLRTCADELTARGLDAQALVRFGLLSEVTSGVFASCMTAWLGPLPLSEAAETKSEAWLLLFRGRLERSGLPAFAGEGSFTWHQVSKFATIVIEAVVPWVLSAPLNALLTLKPPTSEELTACPTPPERDGQLWEAYRWLVDRFSVTRLADWETRSLHLEHMWLEGRAAAPCRPALMEEHRIDRAALDSEIARRAVANPVVREQRQLRASLAARMVSQASALLNDGKYERAATLFEFAVQEDPADAHAHNNLGFCRLPTDPRSARRHLTQAASLGYEPSVVGLCNRVLCAYLLHGAATAVALADDEWNDAPSSPRHSSLLWELEGGSFNLVQVDARTHLTKFVAAIALEAGLEDRAEAWSQRIVA